MVPSLVFTKTVLIMGRFELEGSLQSLIYLFYT